MNIKLEHKVMLGGIISGTLRNQDLIPLFVDEILWYNPNNKIAITVQEGLYDINSDDDEYWSSENANYDYEDLVSQLNEVAETVPYCYFGTSPDDGSSFGFWIDSESAIEDSELQVSDLNDIPPAYSGSCIHINDHGNVTLYAVNKGELTEIWGVV